MSKAADISIHPGVVNGRRMFPLESSTKPQSMARLHRQLAGIEKHLEQHPRDILSINRVEAIKAILSGDAAAKKRAA